MKRHAMYFALALAGAAFTLQAAPLPAMPDPTLPVSHFITQVNADKSITYRLFAPDARRVSVVTGATPDSFVSHDMTKEAQGVWTWKSEPMKPNLYGILFRCGWLPLGGYRQPLSEAAAPGEYQFDSGTW